MCKAGREVPGEGITTQTLVVEEPWGEIWRSTHEQLGPVLFIAYTTPAGTELFQDALPWLRRWEDSGSTVKGHLLPILKISAETAIPYILVKDPGGPVLREAILSRGDDIEADRLVRGGLEWVEGAVTATTLNLAPIGITPDTLFRGEAGWCIAPIAPRSKLQQKLLGRGRYVAPDMSLAPDTTLTNADCYAIAWIMADILAGEWDQPHDPSGFQAAVPVEKLTEAIKVGMVSNKGMYVDPNHYDLGLRRWLRNDADKDVKKYAKHRKQQAKKREKEEKKNGQRGESSARSPLPAACAVPSDASVPAGVIAPPPESIAPAPISTPKEAPAKSSASGGEIVQKILVVLAYIVVGGIFAAAAYFIAKKYL